MESSSWRLRKSKYALAVGGESFTISWGGGGEETLCEGVSGVITGEDVGAGLDELTGGFPLKSSKDLSKSNRPKLSIIKNSPFSQISRKLAEKTSYF